MFTLNETCTRHVRKTKKLHFLYHTPKASVLKKLTEEFQDRDKIGPKEVLMKTIFLLKERACDWECRIQDIIEWFIFKCSKGAWSQNLFHILPQKLFFYLDVFVCFQIKKRPPSVFETPLFHKVNKARKLLFQGATAEVVVIWNIKFFQLNGGP